MTCETVQSRISQYIDGELPPTSESDMFTHISSCETCRNFLRRSLAVREALSRRLGVAAPDVPRRAEAHPAVSRWGRGEPRRSIRVSVPLSAAISLSIILVVFTMLVSPILFYQSGPAPSDPTQHPKPVSGSSRIPGFGSY